MDDKKRMYARSDHKESVKESREAKTTTSATRKQINAEKGSRIYLLPHEPPLNLTLSQHHEQSESLYATKMRTREAEGKGSARHDYSSNVASRTRDSTGKDDKSQKYLPNPLGSPTKQNKSFSSNTGTSSSRTSFRSSHLTNDSSSSSYDGDREYARSACVTNDLEGNPMPGSQKGDEKNIAQIDTESGMPVSPRTKEAFERRQRSTHHAKNELSTVSGVIRRAHSERVVIRNEVSASLSNESAPRKCNTRSLVAIDRRKPRPKEMKNAREVSTSSNHQAATDRHISATSHTSLRRAQSEREGRQIPSKYKSPHLMRCQSDRGVSSYVNARQAVMLHEPIAYTGSIPPPPPYPHSPDTNCSDPRQHTPKSQHRRSPYTISPINPLFSPVQSLMPETSPLTASVSSRYRSSSIHDASEADSIDIFASPRQVRRHMLELQSKQPDKPPSPLTLERQSSYGPGGRLRTYQLDLSPAQDNEALSNRKHPGRETTTTSQYDGNGIPFMPDIMRKKKNNNIDLAHQESIGFSTSFPPNHHSPLASPLFSSLPPSRDPYSPSRVQRYATVTEEGDASSFPEYGVRQSSWPPPSFAFSPPLRHQIRKGMMTSSNRRELQRGHSYSKAPDLESILTSDEEEEGGDDTCRSKNGNTIGDKPLLQVRLLEEEKTPLLPSLNEGAQNYGAATQKITKERDRRREYAMTHAERVDPLVSSVQASIARSNAKRQQIMLESSPSKNSNSSSSNTGRQRRRSRRLSKMHHNMRRITQDLEAWNNNNDNLEERAILERMGPCYSTFCSQSQRQDSFWTIFFLVQVLLTIFLGLWSISNGFFDDHSQLSTSITSFSASGVLDQLKDIGSITLGCGSFAMLLGGVMLVLIASRNGYHYVVMDRNLIPVSIMLTIFLSFAWGILGVRVLPGSYSPALGFIVCMVCAGYAAVIWPRISFSSTNLHYALTGIRHAGYGLCCVTLVAQLVLVIWSTWCALTVVGLHHELVVHHLTSSSTTAQEKLASTAIIVYVILSFIWTFQFIVHWVQVVVAHVIGQWWAYRDHSGGRGDENDEVNSLTAPTCDTSTIESTRKGIINKGTLDDDEEAGARLLMHSSSVTATAAVEERYVLKALHHAFQSSTLKPICSGSLWVIWVQMARHLIEQFHDSTTVKHLSDRENPFISAMGSHDGDDEENEEDEDEIKVTTQNDRNGSNLTKRRESFRESVSRTSKNASGTCWLCMFELLNCIWPTRRRRLDHDNNVLGVNDDIRIFPLCWKTVHTTWDPMYNKWGFIFLGLYHQHGHLNWKQASVNAHNLLQIRGWYSNSLANDNLIPNVLRLVSFVIGGCTGCFGLGWVELFVKHQHDGASKLTNMHHIAFIIGLIVGTTLTSVIMNVVVAGVNTILLCYAGSHPHNQHRRSERSKTSDIVVFLDE